MPAVSARSVLLARLHLRNGFQWPSVWQARSAAAPAAAGGRPGTRSSPSTLPCGGRRASRQVRGSRRTQRLSPGARGGRRTLVRQRVDAGPGDPAVRRSSELCDLGTIRKDRSVTEQARRRLRQRGRVLLGRAVVAGEAVEAGLRRVHAMAEGDRLWTSGPGSGSSRGTYGPDTCAANAAAAHRPRTARARLQRTARGHWPAHLRCGRAKATIWPLKALSYSLPPRPRRPRSRPERPR